MEGIFGCRLGKFSVHTHARNPPLLGLEESNFTGCFQIPKPGSVYRQFILNLRGGHPTPRSRFLSFFDFLFILSTFFFLPPRMNSHSIEAIPPVPNGPWFSLLSPLFLFLYNNFLFHFLFLFPHPHLLPLLSHFYLSYVFVTCSSLISSFFDEPHFHFSSIFYSFAV